MIKKLLLTTVAMIGFMGTTAVASDLATILSSTYGLYENGSRICTGQFFRSDEQEDLFLTAAHCATSGKTYTIRKQTRNDELDVIFEEIYYLEILKDYTKQDIAVLRVITPNIAEFTTVDIAEKDSFSEQAGANLLAVTIPAVPVDPNTAVVDTGYLTGLVKAVLSPNKGELFYNSNIVGTNGSSGGGLYGDFDGEWKLIGTAHAASPMFPFATLWSTAGNVREVVDLAVQSVEKKAAREAEKRGAAEAKAAIAESVEP